MRGIGKTATVSEIEFLDPVPQEVDAPVDATGLFAVPPALTMIAPVLWLAAAGLAVAGAFGKVYSVVIVQDGQRSRSAIDAWGRYAGGGSDLSGAHGTRYAIPLVVFAGALVVAGVVALSSLARPEHRGARLGTITGALGLGGCAAVAASLYLDGAAARDTFAAEQRSTRTDDPLSSFQQHITTGSAVWFGIAATACALLALVSVPVVRRLTAGSTDSPRDAVDVGRPEAEPVDGEVLSWPDGRA